MVYNNSIYLQKTTGGEKKKMLSIASIELHYQQDVMFIMKVVREYTQAAGLSQLKSTKFITALSEICRNAFQYANGGQVELFIEHRADKQFFGAHVIDKGKGISELDKVLNGDYTSDTGIGLGIKGSKKLVDFIDINTSEEGTRVTLGTALPIGKRLVDHHTIEQWEKKIEEEAKGFPLQELKGQNKRLIEAYKTIQEKEESLTAANKQMLVLIEQLENKNEELKSFAHEVSHDLKSPLNVVFMATEMANTVYGDAVTPELKEMFDMVFSSAEAMKRIVNDYLAYATASAHEDRKETINMNEFTKKVVEYAENSKHVEIYINDLADIYYDKTAIRQVLQNLVSNAIKYCDKEIVIIEISTTENDQEIVLSVKDNGPGIDKQYHKEIFEPYRTFGKSKNDETGTGLGLPLIKKIADRNNGRVWLDSEVDKGSTFYFSILKE